MKHLHLILIFALLALASPSILAQDTSCGIAWGPVLNLSGNAPDTFWPHVAVQGETLHVTWFGGGYRLPYRRSTDGGTSWEATREMINDTSVAFAQYPWVVADSRFVYLIYAKTTSQGSSPVCFMKSSDGGAWWSPEDSISGERANAIRTVSLRADTIVLQFPRPSPHNTYCLFKTTDGGIEWDSSLIPVRGPIVVGGGALHNAWGQAMNGQEVVYKRSLTLGDSWQDSVVISTLDGEWSHNTQISISDAIPPRIYVMWRDTKYGCLTLVGCSIIMRVSGDGGMSWGGEYVMTDSPVGYNWDWGQQIATNEEKVVAVWANDQTGHINMRYSVDQGDSWSPLCDVTPGRSTTDPSCAITPTAVHVLWEDIDTSGTGGIHIYYRRGIILSNFIEQPPNLANQFVLLQNFPNPFNSQTQIMYRLEHFDTEPWVTLKVFNILGQEVATLVNERQGEGRHSATWDGGRASSGAYTYRLSVLRGTSSITTSSRTMMLLK